MVIKYSGRAEFWIDGDRFKALRKRFGSQELLAAKAVLSVGSVVKYERPGKHRVFFGTLGSLARAFGVTRNELEAMLADDDVRSDAPSLPSVPLDAAVSLLDASERQAAGRLIERNKERLPALLAASLHYLLKAATPARDAMILKCETRGKAAGKEGRIDASGT